MYVDSFTTVKQQKIPASGPPSRRSTYASLYRTSVYHDAPREWAALQSNDDARTRRSARKRQPGPQIASNTDKHTQNIVTRVSDTLQVQPEPGRLRVCISASRYAAR
ncbi:hypothetical protein FA95DRAFT_545813 [Auriscalpium vulgare]|uniref:Uncharacterized protein n=1 Tax=Auriscalpium vulgare TaxID=40419 RepID=A0ACB8RF37_9AGAM|nr:hypothetical protein FA95DRAFT_545813 [Auriscalpium vulgare]